MAELNNSGVGQWSEVDASNNQASPNGWTSGVMLPSEVEPTARGMMGGLKRWWNRINGAVTSTGSAGAYVYTTANTAFPTAYVNGEVYKFYANFTSVGADTMAINALGAKPIYVATVFGILPISAGQIQTGQYATLVYQSTLNAGGGGWILQNAAIVGTVRSLSIATTGGTVTLTSGQLLSPVLVFTGVLASNSTINFPSGISWNGTVLNLTTGAFTMTLANAGGGSSVIIGQGVATSAISEGTNMYQRTAWRSPTFTGVPAAPTASVGTNTTQIATTALVFAQAALLAPLASPALTGNPTAPTPAAGDNDTSIATTAFAMNMTSPTFLGTPRGPTAAPGSSGTQLATLDYANALAFSAGLPAQTGNAGKFVTTNGTSASWAVITGGGGATATGNVTLTATSGGSLTITPTGPGLFVTLPDATTCALSSNNYNIFNAGDWDYGIRNSAGTRLGWIRARSGCSIGLSVNGTAAGTWTLTGAVKMAVVAEFFNSTTTNLTQNTLPIDMGSGKTLHLLGTTDVYGLVHDATTNAWGALTLIRSGVSSGRYFGIQTIAGTQAIVCSCDSTTGFQTVVLTIAGTAITVNTPVSTTLASDCGVIPAMVLVGTSVVVAYTRPSATANNWRAITISGTVPTIGAETSIGTVGAFMNNAKFYVSGSVARFCFSTANSAHVWPFTVSGSTLTTGTAYSSITLDNFVIRHYQNSLGNIVMFALATNLRCFVIKLTGTVEVGTAVDMGAPITGGLASGSDYLDLGGGKAIVMWASSATQSTVNIITDTAGTVSQGTALVYNISNTIVVGLVVSANIARFGLALGTETYTIYQYAFTTSGASPVLAGVTTQSNAQYGTLGQASDPLGRRSSLLFRIGSTAYSLGNAGNVSGDGMLTLTPNSVFTAPRGSASGTRYANTNFPGASDIEGWTTNTWHASSNTGIIIDKWEVAA